MKYTIRMAVLMLLTIGMVFGCSSPEQSMSVSKEKEMNSDNETKEKNNSFKNAAPAVSISLGQSSKPIIEFEGSAKEIKEGELYEVPNRFPIEEKEERERLEEQRKKDEQDKKIHLNKID